MKPERNGPASGVLRLLLLALLGGCAASPAVTGGPGQWSWQGRHRIDSFLEVPPGTTLRLAPGTVLEFVREDRDGDGYGDNGLHVYGRIVAEGGEAGPVVFTSAEGDPAPGDWAGLLLDNSRDNVFEDCVFEYARHAFHSHFSSARIVRSRIENNIEGTRLGDSRFEIAWSLIRGNVSKGINFRASANHIHHNSITGNGTGIFLFERDTESVIERNSIHGNEGYDFRLGDFYVGGIRLRDNWWGTADVDEIRRKIYEGEGSGAPGRVGIVPAPSPVETGWEGR